MEHEESHQYPGRFWQGSPETQPIIGQYAFTQNGHTNGSNVSSQMNIGGGSSQLPNASMANAPHECNGTECTDTTLQLKGWITKALASIGDANGSSAAVSSLYIEACMKVAKSLTEQLNRAEKLASYGVSKKLDVLPIDCGTEWAMYTTVRLKNIGENDGINGQQQEQKREGTWEPLPSDAAQDAVRDDDLNKQLDALLETFGAAESGEVDPATTVKQSNNSETNAQAYEHFDWISGAMVGWEQEPPAQQRGNNHTGAESDGDSRALAGIQNDHVNFDATQTKFSPPTSSEEENENDIDKDLNKELEAFLKRFGGDDLEGSELVKLGGDQTAPDSASTPVNEHAQCSANTSPNSIHQTGLKSISNASVSGNKDTINYLGVDSAEIRCPERSQSNPSNNDDIVYHDRLKRIYYLALVFYELFSGGEKPPLALYQLASTDGAFVSLPTLTLVDPSNEDDMNSPNEPKRRQGPSGLGDQVGLCALSFEYLKFIGVPGPICHLIFNMLDCIYGALSGSESYTCISDISSDLQLMLDKPKLLKGLDMNNLSSSELPLEDLCIPRDQEIQSILTSYQQCMSGSLEVVVVKGESGAGKSILAQCVASSLISNGGLVLMGKFDQMQQSRPFSALASALDQYLDVLISQLGSDWAGIVVHQLQMTLGKDASFLIKVLPKLGLILGNTASCQSPDFDNNFGNAVQRIQYLLCQFVEVISTTSIVSVTLCLDDVQWVDEASISVLDRVLSQARQKFFFLACCRDNEMSNDHPFWKVIESARGNSIASKTVELKNSKEDVVNTALSDLLCLSPRLTKPLSRIIFHKTKGNPQFIAELLRSLNRDGLLRIDLNVQRWVWNEEKICSAKLPDNVALCFIDGIKKLPVEVQLAIHTLSMFGASIKHECIKSLETHLGVNISEPLKTAMSEGLVDSIKGSYHFCHDRIQETSYKMILEQDRLCNHLTYGRCLAQLALQTSDDDMLFTAVNQINFGGPSAVTVKDEYYVMAQYNLTAGKKAMQMSDFHSAYNFLDNGITFLRKNNWKQHYQFSLEIYNLAAKSALASGNIGDFGLLSDHILRYAHSFDDKLNIHYMIMCSMVYNSNVLKSLEKGLQILSQLGEDIIYNPTQKTLDHLMQQTLAMVSGISKDNFLTYKIMTDSRKLIAMKFMAKIQNTAFFVNHYLHSYLILKMTQMTISYGLSPMSPVGFVTFGNLLAKMGQIKLGGWFTVLAKSLNEKMGSKEAAGEVLLLATEVQCYIEPMLAANEGHLQGETASLSAGDSHCASFNRFCYCSNLYWSGTCLLDVKEKIEKACIFIKDRQHEQCLKYILLLKSTCLMLMDCETEIPRRIDLLKTLQNEPRFQMTIAYHDMYLALILNYGDLKESCKKYFEQEIKSGCILYNESVHSFMGSLAAFRLYRETQSLTFAEKGRQLLQQIKVCADQGSKWNFEHMLFLCEAEENYSLGDFDSAKELYMNAIAAARTHKFQSDEALAYELAARFYLETGDNQSSLQHFRKAHEAYYKWGAISKASKLFTCINDKFSSFLPASCPIQR